MSHEEGFCTLAATILILSVSLCNTAFAVDLTDAEPIEPSYLEIIEDIFPGYQDGQVSPLWTSGAPDAANPKTHGYITQVAYNLIRNDNSAAYSFYSGRLTKLVRGSVLPDDDETTSAFAWHFYGEDGKITSAGPPRPIQSASSTIIALFLYIPQVKRPMQWKSLVGHFISCKM